MSMESEGSENACVVLSPPRWPTVSSSGGIVSEGWSDDNRLQTSQLKRACVLRFREKAHCTLFAVSAVSPTSSAWAMSDPEMWGARRNGAVRAGFAIEAVGRGKLAGFAKPCRSIARRAGRLAIIPVTRHPQRSRDAARQEPPEARKLLYSDSVRRSKILSLRRFSTCDMIWFASITGSVLASVIGEASR
jgi:hypothetical protein